MTGSARRSVECYVRLKYQSTYKATLYRRGGFVPETRRQVFAKLHPLVVPDCPFVNLAEKEKSHWGTGLTADDMEKCVWVRPELVARIEYLEWTDGDHSRHAKFAGLRIDKEARNIIKEHAGEA